MPAMKAPPAMLRNLATGLAPIPSIAQGSPPLTTPVAIPNQAVNWLTLGGIAPQTGQAIAVVAPPVPAITVGIRAQPPTKAPPPQGLPTVQNVVIQPPVIGPPMGPKGSQGPLTVRSRDRDPTASGSVMTFPVGFGPDEPTAIYRAADSVLVTAENRILPRPPRDPGLRGKTVIRYA